MSPVRISVVVRSYNYERYIKVAIESILNQTRPADEIIVLDDGSTDGSREIISAFGDKIRAILKEHQGFNITTNRGYAETRGNVVMYLDADDVLYPKALDAVEKAFRPGIVKVQFDLDIIDEDGRLLGRRYCNFEARTGEDDTAREFSRTGTYVWPVTSGNAYAREFMDQVMPMNPPVGFDGALNTVAPLYGGIATIAEPMGQYRLHWRNMSLVNDRGVPNVVPDFARKIRFRKLEFDLLREHAVRLGKTVPAVDFLDNELVFVDYRMMARKVGKEDEGDGERPLIDLWRTGVQLILRSDFGWGMRVTRIVWLTGLALAPRSVARLMILARFSRNHLRARLSRLVSRKHFSNQSQTIGFG